MKRAAVQLHVLICERAYLHNGGHVYTIIHKSNGEDRLDLDWEMLEHKLPSPEQGPANNRHNKCGNEFDTRPCKYRRPGLLQAVHHEYTGSEDEDVANEVNSPELAPRMDRSAKVSRPEDDETEHADEARGDARCKSVSGDSCLLPRFFWCLTSCRISISSCFQRWRRRVEGRERMKWRA